MPQVQRILNRSKEKQISLYILNEYLLIELTAIHHRFLKLQIRDVYV